MEGGQAKTWRISLKFEGWSDAKCTKAFEARGIKVLDKVLEGVVKDWETAPRAGHAVFELDARDRDEASERVLKVLAECGAQGAVQDISLAPDLGPMGPTD
jgi:hypothetical protein